MVVILKAVWKGWMVIVYNLEENVPTILDALLKISERKVKKLFSFSCSKASFEN